MVLDLDDAEAAFLEAILAGTETSFADASSVDKALLPHGPPCPSATGSAPPTESDGTSSSAARLAEVAAPPLFPVAPPQPSQLADLQPQRRETQDSGSTSPKQLAPLRHDPFQPCNHGVHSSIKPHGARSRCEASSASPHVAQAAPELRAGHAPSAPSTATPHSPSRTLSLTSRTSCGTCGSSSRGTSTTDGSGYSTRRRAFAALPPRATTGGAPRTTAGGGGSGGPDVGAAAPVVRAHPLRRAREAMQQALLLEGELQGLLLGQQEQHHQQQEQQEQPCCQQGQQPPSAMQHSGATCGGTTGHAPAHAHPQQQQQQQQLSSREGWRHSSPLHHQHPSVHQQEPHLSPHACGPPLPGPEALPALAQRLCAAYNGSAVALLEAGLASEAREQLDKAAVLVGPGGPLEAYQQKQRELQAVVHNNFACYYRRLQQPETALEHLHQAAQLETAAAAAAAAAAAGTGAAATAPAASGTGGTGFPARADSHGGAPCGPGALHSGRAAAAAAEPGPSAATLLNFAACHSSLGRHGQALACAEQAVPAAARELQVPLPALEAALLEGLAQAQLVEALPQLRHADRAAGTQLAMAYYNRAVEQEHMLQWSAALQSYQLAVHAASRFLGRGAELTQTMQQSSEAFRARLRRLERQGKVPAGVFGPAPNTARAGFVARRSSGGGSGGGCGGGSPGVAPPHTHARVPGAIAEAAAASAPQHHSPASRRLRPTWSASAGTVPSPPRPPPTGATPRSRPEGLPVIRRPASVPAGTGVPVSAASPRTAQDGADPVPWGTVEAPGPVSPLRSTASEEVPWSARQRPASHAWRDGGSAAVRSSKNSMGSVPAEGLHAPQAAEQGVSAEMACAVRGGGTRAAFLPTPAGPGPPAAGPAATTRAPATQLSPTASLAPRRLGSCTSAGSAMAGPALSPRAVTGFDSFRGGVDGAAGLTCLAGVEALAEESWADSCGNKVAREALMLLPGQGAVCMLKPKRDGVAV